MKFNSTLKTIVATIASMAVVALLVWVITTGRNEPKQEEGPRRSVAESSSVPDENGNATLIIGSIEQVNSGISVQTLTSSFHQREIRSYGTVVPLQQLADVFQNHSNAKAQVLKANATTSTSQKEYLRIKELYDKKLESGRNLQTAEADWRSDEATAQAARSTLVALESSIRQEWGATIAQWIYRASPEFDGILTHKDNLIEVTLALDERPSPIPQTAFVRSSINDNLLKASFVSTSQSADARFQGTVVYYVAASSSDRLLGGMNVDVFLPTGEKTEGIDIPRSAVVWWHGRAWVYMKKGPEAFVRIAIPVDQPTEAGWFVPNGQTGFSNTLPIVARGAQLLLSAEYHPQKQSGEEKDEE